MGHQSRVGTVVMRPMSGILTPDLKRPTGSQLVIKSFFRKDLCTSRRDMLEFTLSQHNACNVTMAGCMRERAHDIHEHYHFTVFLVSRQFVPRCELTNTPLVHLHCRSSDFSSLYKPHPIPSLSIPHPRNTLS
jgi:hypothetical protein